MALQSQEEDQRLAARGAGAFAHWFLPSDGEERDDAPAAAGAVELVGGPKAEVSVAAGADAAKIATRAKLPALPFTSVPQTGQAPPSFDEHAAQTE